MCLVRGFEFPHNLPCWKFPHNLPSNIANFVSQMSA